MITHRATPSVSVTSRLTSTGLLLIGLLLIALALLTNFDAQARPLTVHSAAPDSVAATGAEQVVFPRTAPAGASLPRVRPATPHYSPVIERTAAGVRVMPDFSARAHQPGRTAHSARHQAALTQRARQLATAYNTDSNLLGQ